MLIFENKNYYTLKDLINKLNFSDTNAINFTKDIQSYFYLNGVINLINIDNSDYSKINNIISSHYKNGISKYSADSDFISNCSKEFFIKGFVTVSTNEVVQDDKSHTIIIIRLSDNCLLNNEIRNQREFVVCCADEFAQILFFLHDDKLYNESKKFDDYLAKEILIEMSSKNIDFSYYFFKENDCIDKLKKFGIDLSPENNVNETNNSQYILNKYERKDKILSFDLDKDHKKLIKFTDQSFLSFELLKSIIDTKEIIDLINHFSKQNKIYCYLNTIEKFWEGCRLNQNGDLIEQLSSCKVDGFVTLMPHLNYAFEDIIIFSTTDFCLINDEVPKDQYIMGFSESIDHIHEFDLKEGCVNVHGEEYLLCLHLSVNPSIYVDNIYNYFNMNDVIAYCENKTISLNHEELKNYTKLNDNSASNEANIDNKVLKAMTYALIELLANESEVYRFKSTNKANISKISSAIIGIYLDAENQQFDGFVPKESTIRNNYTELKKVIENIVDEIFNDFSNKFSRIN